MNIQHDANHGSLSRNHWVNRFFGLSQNYIGGSTVLWIHQHVVQHHVHTNDVTRNLNVSRYLINPS
jgi:fatty acid desaturase (delta-4 desaturase)